MSSGSNDGHHGGVAHVVSPKLLLGVWAALMVLTGLTVTVTKVDLGYSANLAVAMLVATVKAGLVVAFFMHLVWDRGFHSLIFLGSLAFVLLFVAFVLQDTGAYQQDISPAMQEALSTQRKAVLGPPIGGHRE